MDLSVSHWKRGEKLLFVLACLGALILLGLTVKASLETGVTPEREQNAFNLVFLVSIALSVALIVSHGINNYLESKQEEDA